ncbi:MAG TPA: ABC transporter permease [Candidatus Methylacidiphilales bacterium]|jgi:ABC-type Na+ efflux pump permease subunit|nr:ABC transporter permease [Candidatus Methylacidiphilales bacterium]
MISSLYRIFTIGRNTLTESIRQKVLNVLLIFALVLVASSFAFSGLGTPGLDASGMFDAQIKFVKDAGCGAIGIFGFLITLLSTAQLIPQELHNRTIYTILAKPVRRSEFLLGKFVGMVLLLTLCTALMSLAFAATLYWQEKQAVEQTEAVYDRDSRWKADPGRVADYNHDVAGIVAQIRDPQLVEAVLLIYFKLLMTTAIALLISTFATSSIFTIVTTFLIYLIGHMEGTARDFWLASGANSSIWQSGLVGFISLLIPDMNSFTIVDEILAGNKVPWTHMLNLLGYADVYIIVLLAVSVVIFDYREI